MAELFNKIKADLRQAMIDKDDFKKNLLRVVVGEVQRKIGAENDEDVCKVIKKIIEGNNETIKSAEDNESVIKLLDNENCVLNTYLPKLWTFEEVEAFFLNSDNPEFEQIQGVKSEGLAMGIAMKALKAAGAPVDGKVVGEVVRDIRREYNG